MHIIKKRAGSRKTFLGSQIGVVRLRTKLLIQFITGTCNSDPYGWEFEAVSNAASPIWQPGLSSCVYFIAEDGSRKPFEQFEDMPGEGVAIDELSKSAILGLLNSKSMVAPINGEWVVAPTALKDAVLDADYILTCDYGAGKNGFLLIFGLKRNDKFGLITNFGACRGIPFREPWLMEGMPFIGVEALIPIPLSARLPLERHEKDQDAYRRKATTKIEALIADACVKLVRDYNTSMDAALTMFSSSEMFEKSFGSINKVLSKEELNLVSAFLEWKSKTLDSDVSSQDNFETVNASNYIRMNDSQNIPVTLPLNYPSLYFNMDGYYYFDSLRAFSYAPSDVGLGARGMSNVTLLAIGNSARSKGFATISSTGPEDMWDSFNPTAVSDGPVEFGGDAPLDLPITFLSREDFRDVKHVLAYGVTMDQVYVVCSDERGRFLCKKSWEKGKSKPIEFIPVDFVTENTYGTIEDITYHYEEKLIIKE